MANNKPDALEMTEELFAFLQGKVQDGYRIKADDVPKLSADQAWTVIWYLGELHWQVTDYIERCDVCGELFDSNAGGAYMEGNKPPHHFCDNCRDGVEYREKKAKEKQ